MSFVPARDVSLYSAHIVSFLSASDRFESSVRFLSVSGLLESSMMFSASNVFDSGNASTLGTLWWLALGFLIALGVLLTLLMGCCVAWFIGRRGFDSWQSELDYAIEASGADIFDGNVYEDVLDEISWYGDSAEGSRLSWSAFRDSEEESGMRAFGFEP
jgi:hypothetical protein